MLPSVREGSLAGESADISGMPERSSASEMHPISCMSRGKSKIGVGVVGLGVGAEHARAFLGTGGCELRWVYDLESTKAQQTIQHLGAGAAASSFEQILQDANVQVVSIASYDDAHFEQTLAAIRAGKHVFVEKPLCRSAAELRAVKQAWAANGYRHLASNLVLRAAPVYQWLRRMINAGEFGELYAFDGDYLFGRIEKITQGWRKDVDGYSVMQGGGVHLVDLMLWLTGQKPVSVVTVGNRISTAGTGFRYDDYMASTFLFPSGLIGRITANFGCVHRHQHVVRLFGTAGTFICDDLGPRLHTSRDPSLPARVLDLTPLPVSKGELIPGFVAAILKGEDTRGQTQHEFDVISACVAADESLAVAGYAKVEYV